MLILLYVIHILKFLSILDILLVALGLFILVSVDTIDERMVDMIWKKNVGLLRDMQTEIKDMLFRF
jgi:hypothetical protein